MTVKSALAEMLAGGKVQVPAGGAGLLEMPLWNKGTAFTNDERRELGLAGLLPPHVDTLSEQVERAYDAFTNSQGNLQKHIFLRQLQDENEVLFYQLLMNHVTEMMPIIYTPTVGDACQQFSHIYRRPRGLFLSYPERDQMENIFDNVVLPEVGVMVVTDGERILGLGDQGAGGMGIPIGKLSLYILCGGIHPATTLPIVLDVGTNNPERLNDPRYVGWRHERITGDDYDSFIEQFVQTVDKKFPGVLLQWEDFASHNAARILARYQDRLCTFNDDIQGTASVTTAGILSAVAVSGQALKDQRIVMLGAGSAGVGVSEQLIQVMQQEGLTEEQARRQFYMMDSKGLIHAGRSGLSDVKQRFAQPAETVAPWNTSGEFIDLLQTMQNAKPTCMIGLSGQPGAMAEPVVREMAKHVEKPILFPLSNPTSRAEADPNDLMEWTNGNALIATGSPFDAVEYQGRRIPISQCNNCYIFPAMGLAIRAVGISRVPDSLFITAAKALRECSPAQSHADAPLLPALENIREVARAIALAVAQEAQTQGLATHPSDDLKKTIDDTMWKPEYLPTTLKK